MSDDRSIAVWNEVIDEESKREVEEGHYEFKMIFFQFTNLICAARIAYESKNSVMIHGTKNQLKENIEYFATYTQAIQKELKGKLRRQSGSIVEDYRVMAMTMFEAATGIYKIEELRKIPQIQNLPAIHKQMIEMGFDFKFVELKGEVTYVRGYDDEEGIEHLWIQFKETFIEYMESFHSDGTTEQSRRTFRLSSATFSEVIDISFNKLRHRIKKVTDIESFPTIDSITNHEVESDFQNEVYISLTYMPQPSRPEPIITINWPQVSSMIQRVAGIILSYYRNSQYSRNIIGNFLSWYELMNGSRESIYSIGIRHWVYLGIPRIREMAKAIYNIPAPYTNYGQTMQEFLGCRGALGTWYIGLLEALAMGETNRTMQSAFISAANDLKRYCR